MTSTGMRNRAGKALAAGALALAALGSAQATLVVGVWDPQFDAANFGNLGWRGKVVADVPSACLALAGPSDNNLTLVPICAPTTILSATVEFYDITATFPEPTLETLVFTTALPPVTDVGIQLPGNPVALRTGISSAVTATVEPLAQFLGQNVDYSLELDYTLAGPIVNLYWQGDAIACENAGVLPDDCKGKNTVLAEISYSVPEPLGLALVGPALLALGLFRRRRPG